MAGGIMKVVECVPNFSEGKDLRKIDEITAAINNSPGVSLLSVEASEDYNRVVVTFAGGPQEVREAAFRSIARATELIDMSAHVGHHPRFGAADVCPFVPISGVSMADCVELAEALGRDVGDKLGVPVYLYGEAASRRWPERESLSAVRRGEYEGLAERLKESEWRPDYGPSEYGDGIRKTGALAIGARKLLIAFNVGLNTSDVAQAQKIARRLRESGFVAKKDGKKVRVPGRLKKVQSIGVPIEGGGTEVSMNLMDYEVTPIHVAFEAVRHEAEELGIDVAGSEIVGLVTKEPLLMAGRFYVYAREGSDAELIEAAARGLKLVNFDMKSKVIEYAVGLDG